MIIGVDTGILVAHEIKAHHLHAQVRQAVLDAANLGSQFAVTPAVLAEFVHVV
jgi:predicted nucleic acid-binding protein